MNKIPIATDTQVGLNKRERETMETNRLIFLDFDGVLNHEAFYRKQHAVQKSEIYVVENYPSSEFCPDAVANLNQLIAETGAKVVVSSTWRLGKTVEQLQQILANAGFIGEIVGKTPSLCDKSIFRGNEIHRWMTENEQIVGKVHQYKNYVILDDDSDMLYWQRNNFLLVDRFVGLTKGTVFQAKKILGIVE